MRNMGSSWLVIQRVLLVRAWNIQWVSEWGKGWVIEMLRILTNLRKHGYDEDDIEDGLDPAQQEGDAVDQLLVPTTITAVRHTCSVEWPALGLYCFSVRTDKQSDLFRSLLAKHTGCPIIKARSAVVIYMRRSCKNYWTPRTFYYNGSNFQCIVIVMWFTGGKGGQKSGRVRASREVGCRGPLHLRINKTHTYWLVPCLFFPLLRSPIPWTWPKPSHQGPSGIDRYINRF